MQNYRNLAGYLRFFLSVFCCGNIGVLVIIHIGPLKMKCSSIVSWYKWEGDRECGQRGKAKYMGALLALLVFLFSEEKRICAAPGRGRSNRNKSVGHILDFNLRSLS